MEFFPCLVAVARRPAAQQWFWRRADPRIPGSTTFSFQKPVDRNTMILTTERVHLRFPESRLK